MPSFDEQAPTWDADPQKVLRANGAATAMRARLALGRHLRGFEFGCGTGLLSFALLDDLGPITLVDRAPGMLDVVRQKVEASGREGLTPLLLDLVNDPVPAASWDIAYSLLAFHHASDQDRILRAHHDLLVPDGLLCITDLYPEDGSFHSSAYDGPLGFDPDELTDRVRLAGFEDVVVGPSMVVGKVVDGVERTYPAFLLTARRPA